MGPLAVVDEAVHGQMVSLVGTDRIGAFLGILGARLRAIPPLDSGPPSAEAMAEVHKVVSEAGILGFAELSASFRAMEEALRPDRDASLRPTAISRAVAALRDAIPEIERRSPSSP